MGDDKAKPPSPAEQGGAQKQRIESRKSDDVDALKHRLNRLAATSASPRAARGGPNQDSAKEPAQAIVVLVDDDAGVLRSVEQLLESKYIVRSCCDAESGVAAVDEDVSVVVLDIKMPGRDGFWAYQAIREKNELVPIIFHSAYQDVKDPYQIMNEYRPFGYILKGQPVGILLSSVTDAVRYSQLIRSNPAVVRYIKR